MGFLAETNLRCPWRMATGYAGSGCETECSRRRFRQNAWAIDREQSVTVAASIQETQEFAAIAIAESMVERRASGWLGQP